MVQLQVAKRAIAKSSFEQDRFCNDTKSIETSIEELETGLYNIRRKKMPGDNVYQFLRSFSFAESGVTWGPVVNEAF